MKRSMNVSSLHVFQLFHETDVFECGHGSLRHGHDHIRQSNLVRSLERNAQSDRCDLHHGCASVNLLVDVSDREYLPDVHGEELDAHFCLEQKPRSVHVCHERCPSVSVVDMDVDHGFDCSRSTRQCYGSVGNDRTNLSIEFLHY